MDVKHVGGLKHDPILFVVAGPSGVGKGTVLACVVNEGSELLLSVSATSRRQRADEEDGKDYHFHTREQFLAAVAAGEFFEHAEYCGELYGTPKSELERAAAAGKDLVLEIDVQGARQVRAQRPDAVMVMLLPPSREECCRRLEQRMTESPERLAARIAAFDREIAAIGEFDYAIVNDIVERAAEELKAVVCAERLRTGRGRFRARIEDSAMML